MEIMEFCQKVKRNLMKDMEEGVKVSVDVVRKVRYDSAFTFIYSKRTGTPAAAMENQVAEDVVKDRFDRLLKEVQKIAAETCAVHEGTIHEVLVEDVSEHDKTMVTGRLSNNLLVHFPDNMTVRRWKNLLGR